MITIFELSYDSWGGVQGGWGRPVPALRGKESHLRESAPGLRSWSDVGFSNNDFGGGGEEGGKKEV